MPILSGIIGWYVCERKVKTKTPFPPFMGKGCPKGGKGVFIYIFTLLLPNIDDFTDIHHVNAQFLLIIPLTLLKWHKLLLKLLTI
jgi:hypothetical protein